MIDTPYVRQSAAQQTATIRLTVPRSEIQTVVGPGIREVLATVAAQDISPTGPWFTYHLHVPTEVFDFEICVPVAKRVTPAGRVQPGELAARKVARTIHRGGYEGLGAAWGELVAWIAAAGHEAAPDLWECYTTGPESSTDPATWRTELNRPLLR